MVREKGLDGLSIRYPGNRSLRNPAPAGRPGLAQRFSAGKIGRNDSSPGEPALSEVEGTEFEAHYKLRYFAARAVRRIHEMAMLQQFFRARFRDAEYCWTFQPCSRTGGVC